MNPQDRERLEAHFRANIRVVFWILVVWFLVSYGAALFVKALNKITILTGFPLGFYMGAQGSLIVFVLLIFIYARLMDDLDRKYGVEE